MHSTAMWLREGMFPACWSICSLRPQLRLLHDLAHVKHASLDKGDHLAPVLHDKLVLDGVRIGLGNPLLQTQINNNYINSNAITLL